MTTAAVDMLKARDVVNELSMSIESMEKQFADIDAKFMENLTFLMGSGLKTESAYSHSVQVVSPKEAAKHMLGRKNITVLTGAGISVASGIPTFCSQDGAVWKQKSYGGEMEPTKILTSSFFSANPMAVWEWHHDFHKLLAGKAPSAAH